MGKTVTPAGNCPVDGTVRPVAEARWYVVSMDGRATLCADEKDARKVEHECNLLYPRHGPHRATLLVDMAVERDCRSCGHYMPHHRHDVWHCAAAVRCVDGKSYYRAGDVQLWKPDA